MPNFIYHSLSSDAALNNSSTPATRFGSMAPDFYKGFGVVGNCRGITNPDLLLGLQLHQLADIHFDDLDIIKGAGELIKAKLAVSRERERYLQTYLIKAGVDVTFDGCMLEVYGDSARTLYMSALQDAVSGNMPGLSKLSKDPGRFQDFTRQLAAKGDAVFEYYSSPEHLFHRLQFIAAHRNHMFTDKSEQLAIPVFAALRDYLLPRTADIHQRVTAALKEDPLLSLPRLKPLESSTLVTLAVDPGKDNRYAHPADTLYANDILGPIGSTERTLFLMSRLAMRQALSATGADIDELALPRNPGAPLKMPDGYVGSLTHTHKQSAAVGAIVGKAGSYLGAGIDIESAGRIWTEKTLRAVANRELTGNEIEFKNSEQDLRAVHVIKEACIKALAPAKAGSVGFKEITVSKIDGKWQAAVSEALVRRVGSISLKVLHASNDHWQLATSYSLA